MTKEDLLEMIDKVGAHYTIRSYTNPLDETDSFIEFTLKYFNTRIKRYYNKYIEIENKSTDENVFRLINEIILANQCNTTRIQTPVIYYFEGKHFWVENGKCVVKRALSMEGLLRYKEALNEK